MKNIIKKLKLISIIVFAAGIISISVGLKTDYHLALIIGGGCIGYCSVVFVIIYFKMISRNKENTKQ